MRRQLVAAIRMFVVATIVLGLAYPMAMTGVAQAIFPKRANGSLVHQGDQVVGSDLVGQSFTGPRYFHTRPSAAGALANGSPVQDVDDEGRTVGRPRPADPDDLTAAASGASNQGPTNADLLQAIEQRARAYRAANGLDDSVAVPADAVTASASGIDPHISTANARLQARRVAQHRGLAVEQVLDLIDRCTDRRRLGFLGESAVNVLRLNLVLDELAT